MEATARAALHAHDDGEATRIAPRARVLIVDDTPANLSLLSDLLISSGFEVAVATNGKRALALSRSHRPDVVMLDITMPEMDGYEVCRALKADEQTRSIPVIFLSSLDEVEGKVNAFRAGGVDYVTKPFHVEEVMVRLENQLKIANLTSELEGKKRDLERRNDELARRNDELQKAHHRNDIVFSALSDLLPGKVLDGKYLLEEKVGAGGFGTVFRGKHLELGRAVAVKVFRPSPGNDSPVGLERFRAEGAAACRLEHPNVVSVLDSGISETGIAYLVMELLEGVTLAEEIAAHAPLPVPRCLEIALPVCAVIAEAAGRNLVHRDIKPSNVFLHRGRTGEIVKVVDFGIAKLLGEAPDEASADLTRSGVVLGSLTYMSPERLLGNAYDHRSDVYSLGVILYQALAGRLPFDERGIGKAPTALRHLVEDPTPLRDLAPHLPPGLDSVVMTAMARKPEMRPSAEDLASALASFVGVHSDPPPPKTSVVPPSMPTAMMGGRAGE